jgi:membrane-associated phospholipid phosphatase
LSSRQPAASATGWKITFLVSAGGFVALALAAKFWGVLPGEPQLYQWMVGWASPGVVAVFWWVNQLPNRWIVGAAFLLLLWRVPPTRRRWWLWLGVVVFAPILEDLAKPVVGRPRPEGVSFGFPSGHVTAAAAFFPMAAYLSGKMVRSRRARIRLWLVAAGLVLLVGIARILLRAHWPTDVLGGAALGLACLALAAWWNERGGQASPLRSGKIQENQLRGSGGRDV